jgi:hypothetical protein
MRLMAIILVSAFLLLVDQTKFRGYYTGYAVWTLGYCTLQVVKSVQLVKYYTLGS